MYRKIRCEYISDNFKHLSLLEEIPMLSLRKRNAKLYMKLLMVRYR
jgi:hypothetical protein